MPSGGDPAADITKVADAKKTDPWYPALTTLVEKFGFMPVDAKRNFRGGEAITTGDYLLLLKTAFGYEPAKGEKRDAAGQIMRAEAARHLGLALRHYEDTRLAALSTLPRIKK